ncbi:MAG: hypothetical protein JW862_10625, partial [Anaerolineales bacterium]|nr:hypothetical protein [Anaerolineales bacterium]
LPHLPTLKENEAEAYTFRPATVADLPFLMQVHAYHNRNSLLSCVRDDASWRYELAGRSKENVHHSEVIIITDRDGQAVGFLRHPATVWHNLMVINGYELKAGVSYLAVTPAIFRYAIATGRDYAAEVNAKAKEGADPIEMQGCNFSLGEDHPVYHAYGEHMPRIYTPYNWYLRVPDLPAFLSHIGPVLEQRLADSWAAGHSGDLKMGFYGPGVKLSFEKGQLTGAQAYRQEGNEDGDALFTGRTFLRLLFGYNSMAELDGMFADVFAASDTGRALLPALFPKQSSNIWPIA